MYLVAVGIEWARRGVAVALLDDRAGGYLVRRLRQTDAPTISRVIAAVLRRLRSTAAVAAPVCAATTARQLAANGAVRTPATAFVTPFHNRSNRPTATVYENCAGPRPDAYAESRAPTHAPQHRAFPVTTALRAASPTSVSTAGGRRPHAPPSYSPRWLVTQPPCGQTHRL